jgi:hypothetical protein
MSFDAVGLRVMIASPGDVSDARREVEYAMIKWNREQGERRGVLVVPWRWEIDAIPELTGSPGQCVINAQGVDASDAVIGLFGNRLGTATQNAISGTAEELERARAAGKPVHVYFSDAPIPHDADLEAVLRLREFRKDLERLGLHGGYATLDHLSEQVGNALSHDVDALQSARDSQRGDPRYFDRNLRDRVNEVQEQDWVLRPSATRPDAWDGRCIQRRRVLSRSRLGLRVLTISMSRPTEQYMPFVEDQRLGYELLPGWSRTDMDASVESLTLDPPRRKNGSSFAQDLRLNPPLTDGKSVDFAVAGDFPNFKYAFRGDVISATLHSMIGVRDWECVQFSVSHPTVSFHYSVFLPDVLGAQPIGPKIGPGGDVDSDATATAVSSGQYKCERDEVDGEPGVRLSLDIAQPHVGYQYRLAWLPPVRPQP